MGIHDGDSLGFTDIAWLHSATMGLTEFHLDLRGITWSHLVSLGLTWLHLVSLGTTWPHLASLGLTWTQGKRDQGPRQKGKGNGHHTPLAPGIPPYIQSARGDERNETISRLDSLPQPPILLLFYLAFL